MQITVCDGSSGFAFGTLWLTILCTGCYELVRGNTSSKLEVRQAEKALLTF
jgi:hypothetical protein